MPRRSYYKRATPAPSIPRINLADREPHQIVGSNEWAALKRRVAILEGRSCTSENSTGTTRNELPYRTREDMGASTECIDQILEFVEFGDWAQIEGGEHDKRWVNTRHYPNRIFETGLIKEAGTGEVHYFPIASTDDDLKGKALHYEISAGGSGYTIQPNIWRVYMTYARRKAERRRAYKAERRMDSLAEMEMMNHE